MNGRCLMLLTIQIFLYGVFIDFMCILMYEKYSIIYEFLYHMKMVLARLKIVTLKERITAFVMTMVLMQIKHG